MITRLHLFIYGAFLLVLIALLCYVMILHNKINNLSSFQSVYQTNNQPNKIWQDKDSSWHNKVNDAEVTSSDMKYLSELQDLHKEFDGLKKSLKNLENYSTFSEQTIIHETTPIKETTSYNKDSSNVTHTYTFTYKNKWENISGEITKDSITWSISHSDSLQIVQEWERKWLLGKKTYTTEIKSLNPNTQIHYQKSIKAKKKRRLL